MIVTVRGVGEVPFDASAVGRVYREAFGTTRAAADAFVERYERHRRRDGFRLSAAVDDGALVGFAYAHLGERDQYWTEWVREHAPEVVADEWLGGHLEVVEIAVHPASRRRGIGARLLDLVVERPGSDRALLTVSRTNGPAMRLYAAHGWAPLVEELDQGFSLWGRRLGRE